MAENSRASTVLHSEFLFATATVAAHASCPDGFRQRDVRFFVELFENWAEAPGMMILEVQNTQLARYLDALSNEGFARRTLRQKIPTYRLTRVGLLELLTRLTDRKRRRYRDQFFFLVYFITGYRGWLEELVRKEGAQFPPSLKIELTALLDVDQLLSEEIRDVERTLSKLETRISDAERTHALVKGRLKSGLPFADIVKEVEREIPYELNSRKPLHELIADIRPEQREWELVEGTLLRRRFIWMPQRHMLQKYVEALKQVRSELQKGS